MATRHIFYKNDFAVEITLRDASGQQIAPPEWEWQITFSDGARKYVCSRAKHNAEVTESNTIICYLDNHRFGCGREISYQFGEAIPNAHYADGFQNIYQPAKLDVVLWEVASDGDGVVTGEIIPEYVIYDAYTKAESDAKFVNWVSLHKNVTTEYVEADDANINEVNTGGVFFEKNSIYEENEKLTNNGDEILTTAKIVQEVGTATDKVMSQDAVTKALASAGGGEPTEVITITLTEDVHEVVVSKDANGNPLSLKKIFIGFNMSPYSGARIACCDTANTPLRLLLNDSASAITLWSMSNAQRCGFAHIATNGGLHMWSNELPYPNSPTPLQGGYNQQIIDNITSIKLQAGTGSAKFVTGLKIHIYKL